jgi:hypothetical protein
MQHTQPSPIAAIGLIACLALVTYLIAFGAGWRPPKT